MCRCVAALNDVRMSEVTVRDYEVRWGLSQQYTPLFNELLALALPTAATSDSNADLNLQPPENLIDNI